jgi:hypothetical protein
LDTRPFNENLEVAMSGGGLRASAFGLGVLLYLVDSGLNQLVVSITSVSGSSITNGFVASKCDFGSLTDRAEFRRIAAELAQTISGKGRYRGFWLASRPYLAGLLASGAALLVWLAAIAIALVIRSGWGVELWPVAANDLVTPLVLALLWGMVALNRGVLVRLWISRSFFAGEGVSMKLRQERKVDHVFCATDLTSSCPLFFSTKGGGRVFSERYGRGKGEDVPLNLAIAASAAFPPWIPPIRFRLSNRQFTRGDKIPGYVYLSDGGVWNNLGTDWSRLRSSLLGAEIEWIRQMRGGDFLDALKSMDYCSEGGVLLIANASKPEERKSLWYLKVPGLSFVMTLIRVINVTVNSTVAARAADIEGTARLRMLNNPDRWELGSDAPRPCDTVWGESGGTDYPLAVAVEMTRRPGETAAAYKMYGGLVQWAKKPDEYLEELEPLLEGLKPLLEGEDIAPTTFDNLGARSTLKMIVLGYLNTRETMAVAFANHRAPALPSRQWFEELLHSGGLF